MKPRIYIAPGPFRLETGHTLPELKIAYHTYGELNAAQGTAFLVVTHDLQLAKRMGRQLEMRDGRLNAELTLMGAE